ncbi:synaptic vesicle membrane protein VAT-1 homolog-like [Daphnia pulex]|uniref:synaptic vesicle membrane protein VAT-1 homolog-like n=1 Tax=Daphnia pulex TaxID=6669 RepID=UPI001EE12811|nr:synaptic vesicle membrane protein VAT-1 homolog-like [Daphnia pulex]
MESEKTPSLYPSLNPDTLVETAGEKPTVIQNPTEDRPGKKPYNESAEIQREMRKLRERDEEEFHKKQQEIRRRIDNHLNQHGGDLAHLFSQHVPNEVNCVQLTSFGVSKNVHTTKIPLPLPLNHEILIRAYSCGVNFNDIMTRNGMLDTWVHTLKTPFIMGSEVAGEIVGLGRNVTNFKFGDRVMALPERKAWSEYVVCREEYCFKIPDQMSYHEAVALTVDGIVAHSLLFQMGNLSPGKAVLLHSTPGGLGTMVTQMVRTVPNTRIFKIAMNKEEVQGESADRIVNYIDHDADYVTEIRHSSPHGVDLVLDCQYEDNFQRDFNLLRPMGKYILFGTQAAINRGFLDSARSWWGQEKVSPLKLYEENKSICGFNLRNLLYFQKDRRYIRELFDRICTMWEDGEIQAVYDCVLQFDDFPEALQRMQEHGQNGKIILDPRMTKQESLHERDYYVLAERNVKQRHWQEKPLLNKLGFPEPGELVEDEELAAENKERARQQQQEEMQKKILEQQQQHTTGLMPNLFPVGSSRGHERSTLDTIKEKLTPSFLSRESAEGTMPQANIETVGIAPVGMIIGEPTLVTTQDTFPQLPNPPPLSPYSVENVLSHISSSNEPLMSPTSTISPQGFPSMETQQPILSKEKVELTLPMTTKEMKDFKEEIPGALQEERKQHTGFMEKLRSE